jgi:hypothetical protein
VPQKMAASIRESSVSTAAFSSVTAPDSTPAPRRTHPAPQPWLRSSDAFVLRRSQILLASSRGENAYQIAHQPRLQSPNRSQRHSRLQRAGAPGGTSARLQTSSYDSSGLRPSAGRGLAGVAPDPKAISCYGLYLPEFEEVWLRFVDGRPVSGITTRSLSWCSEKLEALGKKVWRLIWDNPRAGT